MIILDIECPLCRELYCLDDEEGRQTIECDECHTVFSVNVECEWHLFDLKIEKEGEIKDE